MQNFVLQLDHGIDRKLAVAPLAVVQEGTLLTLPSASHISSQGCKIRGLKNIQRTSVPTAGYVLIPLHVLGAQTWLAEARKS